MKKSTLFLLGTLIIGMAFGLLLAGCPGAGTGTGSGGMENPSAAVQAAQLAADINAIKPGIAKVNGTTITLTGRLTLKTDLTVPQGVTLDVTADSSSIKAEGATVNGTTETLTDGLTPKTDLTVSQGVTLDLTADGAVLGLHDMILTVNGTVIVKSNRIGLEDTAAYGIINGSGTIQLKGKGSLLKVGGNKNVADRKLTLDGVTLVGVKDNNDSLVVVRSGGEGRSGEFIMKSGAIMGNTRVSGSEEWSSGGGVRVEDSGTFTMQGGTISGNTAESIGNGAGGGGVRVEGSGMFIMQGGTISGNIANSDDKYSNNKYSEGGGVSLWEGTFIMEGGTISGNLAESGNTAAGGGGVRVSDNSTFIMQGGTISGNITSGQPSSQGGGVNVFKGTFTMEGGRIQGSADSDGFTKNTANGYYVALWVAPADGTTAKWGTGGTYTKGGASQTGGSEIGNTDDTLIAVP
jgi:hypothetical protein